MVVLMKMIKDVIGGLTLSADERLALAHYAPMERCAKEEHAEKGGCTVPLLVPGDIKLSEIWSLYEEKFFQAVFSTKIKYTPHDVGPGESVMPIKAVSLTLDNMLIDAMFGAVAAYLTLQINEHKPISGRKRLNILAQKLEENQFVIEHEKALPCVEHIQELTESRKTEQINSEIRYIDQAFHYTTTLFKAVFEEPPVGVPKEQPNTFKLKFAKTLRRLFFLFLVNRTLRSIQFLYTSDMDRFFTLMDEDLSPNYFLLSIYYSGVFQGNKSPSLIAEYECVFHVVRRWKANILSFLTEEQIPINTGFWNRIACSFSFSIHYSLSWILHALECLEITFHKHYYEKPNAYLCLLREKKHLISENIDIAPTERTRGWFRDPPKLSGNPFNFKLASMELKENIAEVFTYQKFGCPLALFCLKISDIEEILQDVFPSPTMNKNMEFGIPKIELKKLKNKYPFLSPFFPLDDKSKFVKMLFDCYVQYPVLPSMLSPLPCYWEEKDYEEIVMGGIYFPSVSCFSKLRILPDAQKDGRLIKLRYMSKREWEHYFGEYCLNYRDGEANYCYNKKSAIQCQSNFRNRIILTSLDDA